MKIRARLADVGLAISFVLPAFTQQPAAETPSPATTPAASATQEKETVDPQIRQQLETAAKKYEEAFNKNDATATAALFTEDAEG